MITYLNINIPEPPCPAPSSPSPPLSSLVFDCFVLIEIVEDVVDSREREGQYRSAICSLVRDSPIGRMTIFWISGDGACPETIQGRVGGGGERETMRNGFTLSPTLSTHQKL